MPMMWWPASPSHEALTRPRVLVAVVSAVATVASISAYAYYQRSSDPVVGASLHRSNAIRRRRRPRNNSTASTTASESHDENIDVGAPGPLHDGETTAEGQPGAVDEWWTDPQMIPTVQRAGHNIVSLLFRVSEDNARRNACVHRGCQCNSCNMVPIRGIRYRCANCADFDLCETCESQGIHIKTHIFYKIKVPAPPFCPRHMQPVWYTGDPDTCLRNLPKHLILKLSRETGFERPELEAFWEQWTFMANTEWRDDPDDLYLAMDRKTFDRCLVPSGGSRHAAPNLIHDRMFAFYDTNNDDLIGFTEFLHGLAYRKRKEKLRRIFDGYDIDGDGYVNRKDFLRMFRAYYVLYKQMHKDILDGLDDQLMGSTEAQQLVTSRQPLSSIFGREGRVPSAEGGSRLNGKIYHPNGDVELRDPSASVVVESKGDTAGREDILTSLFAASSIELIKLPDTPYLDGLLNPPTNLDDLPALLIGEPRGESFTVAEDAESLGISDDGDNQSNTENEPIPHDRINSNGVNGDSTQAEGSGRLVDPHQFTGNMPSESETRARVIAHEERTAPEEDKRRRVAARKQLHERWKRRQFYLDEEEGGLPPEGWEADEDILLGLNGVGESSKSAGQSSHSPRPRSSSKVRFAEDNDEYETRSNPSTSSRNVPERWGGMDIPDAERDAGKEILYQVTQQAFNELLDVIFKDKEDLAIRAAETKEERLRYADVLQNLDLTELEKGLEESPINPPYDEDDSLFVDERPSAPELGTSPGDKSGEETSTSEEPEPITDQEVIESLGLGDLIVDEEAEAIEAVEPEYYRDPTMPQFRPNSLSSIPAGGVSAVHEDTLSVDDDEDEDEVPSPKTDDVSKAADKGKNVAKRLSGVIPRSTLADWKVLDMLEEQAEKRGAWGMLDYEEFETIYKAQESQGNRLEYLGSWIDFCIP